MKHINVTGEWIKTAKSSLGNMWTNSELKFRWVKRWSVSGNFAYVDFRK
ncbi:MAG: hypothetical protein KBS95_04925 [Alistipes sp.]|nr:hypothetical protein [Candidatus Alistipes equi]